MANSTASIFIKPTVAFNRGDTFVFGSWVCTADGAGSLQRSLTMTPNPKTGLVTIPKVVTGDLAGKFGEISLYSQHADFELGSASNSNLASLWAIVCEPLLSHRVRTPHYMRTSHTASATPAGPMQRLFLRWAGKEIVSEYNSDSNTVPSYNSDPNPVSSYNSDSSYEFELVITSTPPGDLSTGQIASPQT
jgi:hypothetical protein